MAVKPSGNMRGKFNLLCDIFKGPLTAVPNAFVGTFPCRRVLEDGIHATGVGCPTITYYMTIDKYEPVGAWTFPTFGMEPGLADQIAIPAGTPKRYWVLYTDLILWHALTPYWRAYLASLPLPGVIGSGGLVVDGSATWSSHVHPLSAGGIELGGHGKRIVARHFTGSGGVIANSSAVILSRHHFYGQGGVLVDSSAAESVRYFHTGSGGIVVNKAAEWWKTVHFTSKGGVELDSAAHWTFHGSGSGLPHGSVFSTSSQPSISQCFCVNPAGGFPGLADGDTVLLAGIVGVPAMNGTWTVEGHTDIEFWINLTTTFVATFTEPHATWQKL